MKILCMYYNPPWLHCCPTYPAAQLAGHDVRVVRNLAAAQQEINRTFRTGLFDIILSDLAVPLMSRNVEPYAELPLDLLRYAQADVVRGVGMFLFGSLDIPAFATTDTNVVRAPGSDCPMVVTAVCGGPMDSRRWNKLLEKVVKEIKH